MKFDFIIGNPPYQDETLGGNKTFAPPIYNKFLENAYQISDRVEMIHPARFLFNAGSTPKAWNQQMLTDDHLKVLWYVPDSNSVFSNTEIKGGVAITYRDTSKNFGAIGTFTPYTELNDILKRVKQYPEFKSFSNIVYTAYAYKITKKLHEDYPDAINLLSKGHAYDLKSNIFDRLPNVFFDEKPEDEHQYIQILGRENNKRVYKYIRADYVNEVENLYKYKIYMPSVYGRGTLGEALPDLILSTPGVGTTETFISIGCFDTKQEAKVALKYIKTQFTRALVGILKVTQHITPESWSYVPLQDFTSASDLDWSKSIPEIDHQLYEKYGLDEGEIAFIESHVKEME